MKKLFILSVFIFSMFAAHGLQAGDLANDTVWTKKTDQSAGIFQVKFSNNDSIIYAKGLEMSLFFDTQTGEEIIRIPGNEEVFFFNDDNNFIKLNEDRTTIEIFDAKTYEIIDSLENDGTKINNYPKYDLSKNGRYFVAAIPNGFRIWDMNTKGIMRTKIFPEEPNLIDVWVLNTRFTNDNSKIIAQHGKTYKYQDDPDKSYTIGYFIVYDFLSLDSIDVFPNSQYFKLSNTNKYLAYGTGHKDYGVEIYDFHTKQLLHQIPINGPSLTGIEFSPDDKFLVTSNDPGANCLKIWSTEIGKEVYDYPYAGYSGVNVSNNGKLILGINGRNLILYHSRFENTPVQEIPEPENILYPNPTTGSAILNFNNPISEHTNIILIDLSGNLIQEINDKFLKQGEQSFQIDVNDLPNGTYYILIQNSQLNLSYKLIINK